METLALPDLQCFLAIAKALSITRAAQALGKPKAAVSKALARLEERIGVRLFERTTRRLAITRAGDVLQRRAESILIDVESLLEEVRRDETEVRGTLSVAALPELGTWLTGTLFPAYLRRHAGVRLTLSLDYGFHDLFDPAIDLAFRIGTVKDESLVARPFGSFERILVGSPELVRSVKVLRAKPSELAALAEVPCLAFSERGGSSTWTLTDGRITEVVEVSGRFGARSYPALMSAARASLGILQVPDFVAAPQLAQGELVRVLAPWRSPPLTIFAVHRVGHQRIRRVAALFELLEAHREWVPGGERPRGPAQHAPSISHRALHRR